MRLKITDGDFIIVKIDNSFDNQAVDLIKGRFKKWITARGLTNCKLLVVTSEKCEFEVTILTVNDLFEDQVLNGKS